MADCGSQFRKQVFITAKNADSTIRRACLPTRNMGMTYEKITTLFRLIGLYAARFHLC